MHSPPAPSAAVSPKAPGPARAPVAAALTEPSTLRFTVPPAQAGGRLDQALAALMPEHSRSRLQQWIRSARVLVDGLPARAADKVHGGEALEIAPALDPQCLAAQPEAIALTIVHEDASLIVLDKPAGLVVHPGSGNWQGTLLNALLHHHPALEAVPRAGIVHRLDKDTSGLMMVAKSLPAHTALVRALAAREVERVYQAIVIGAPALAGEIDRPVGRHPVQRTRMAVVERGRPALTRYRVLEMLAGATRVECRLSTGRTHQIRVHLESIGHPVLGDPVYAPRANRLPAPLARVGAALGRQAL
ncbi:MAG: RluA family pseudouridine synthase, partial [Proteobacteria bacterium]|nr:RluA family pseudouridine synthase [Burkholderiales bacterium]